jgi:hypothetical protein
MALLRLVTVSGADDEVDPLELVKLSEEFPFVEWGLLYSAKREGLERRYPAVDWLQQFAKTTMRDAGRMRCSVHLCGASARSVAATGVHPPILDVFPEGPRVRVQVNGVLLDTDKFYSWIERQHSTHREVILQLRSDEPLPPLSTRHLVSYLQDDSGGKGKPVNAVLTLDEKIDPARFGVAGGLRPENVSVFLESSLSSLGGFDFSWIDMETGARNEADEFDLDRVRSFLEQCQRYVEPQGAQ